MKKNVMKKVLSLVLSFGLLLSCATPMTAAEVQNDNQVQEVTDQKQALGLSQDELEAQAVKLVLNQASKGVLEVRDEVDYYKFTITDRGYFNVKFAIDSSTATDDINWGWNVELYKDGVTDPIKSYKGIQEAFTFPKLPMEAGDYYLKVYARDTYQAYAPTGAVYQVTAGFTATNTWEVEGNDTQTTANEIVVNQEFSANLYHRKDVDWYKVNVNDKGVIQFSLTVGSDTASEDINWGWNVDIYDSNYNVIKKYERIEQSFTAQILPFSTGTYYIKVYARDTYEAYAPTDCTYNVKLTSIKNSYWESETNEDKATADTIKVNKEYKGLLYHNKDVDWYKVKIDKTGYFKIHFKVDSSVSADDINWGWNVTVYDKNLNEIITYKDLKSSGVGDVLPYEKGTYYVKVCARDSYSAYAPTDCIYSLKVEQKATSAWESEGNNTRKKADTISLEKTYKAHLINSKDEDWFKFTTKANGSVKLTFKLADSDAADSVNWGWNVYIYTKSGSTPVEEIKGVKDKASVTVDLKKGTYYVKVVARDTYNAYAPTLCTYSVTVNYSKAPGKVTLNSVKAGKKQATLKWKKVKDADGYYIYRSESKNGEYKKVKTITKGSTVKYTDKKLKKGKTYYYKVVAYNKTKSVTAPGPASKVKSVKIKK